MAKQGKCSTCKTRFVWDKDIKLEDATCPNCPENTPLEATSNLSELPKRRAYVQTLASHGPYLYLED